MKPDVLLDQLGFVAKVIGLSGLMAIAFKTLGPSLPIPATAGASLAIVLTPAIVLGMFLTWQLWRAFNANPTHPGSD